MAYIVELLKWLSAHDRNTENIAADSRGSTHQLHQYGYALQWWGNDGCYPSCRLSHELPARIGYNMTFEYVLVVCPQQRDVIWNTHAIVIEPFNFLV